MTNELYEKHCWALVDLDAMQSNLALIQKTVGAPVCCVVKADAYGHGAAVAGPWLEENGAAAFAVSCLAEARHLRRHGISKPILILGYTDPLQVDQLAFNCITQTVYSEEYAKVLSAAAQNAGVEVHCHFKVDTGMGRIGFSVRSDFEAAIAAMERCAALPKLHFSGIFQHFAVADSTTPENETYTLVADDEEMKVEISYTFNASALGGKNGGGIHVREKLIANMAEEYMLLIDESKLSDTLQFHVPVVMELLEDATAYVKRSVEELQGQIGRAHV